VRDEELEGLPESLCVYRHRHSVELPLLGRITSDCDAELERFTLGQVALEQAHELVELNLLIRAEDFAKLTVQIDSATIIGVLQPVLLYILP